MKHVLLALWIALLPTPLLAQSTAQDLTTARASPERKAILDALRTEISQDAGVPVAFVVEHLKVQGGWAFMRGFTKRADGGEVDWKRSPGYRDVVEDALFDGSGTAALLKKIKGRWTRAVYVVGPTDVPWVGWWKEYKAPRAIFDLAEDCQ